MAGLRDKTEALHKPNSSDEKLATLGSSINENVKKFYTIEIPSVRMESYTNPGAASFSSVKFLPNDKCIFGLSLTADEHVLPPRIQGKVPSLDERKLARHEQDWSTLIGKSHESGTMGPAARLTSVSQKSELARDEQDWSTLIVKSHESGTTGAAAKKVSVSQKSKLARDEQDWSTLIVKSHESGTTGAAAKRVSASQKSKLTRDEQDLSTFIGTLHESGTMGATARLVSVSQKSKLTRDEQDLSTFIGTLHESGTMGPAARLVSVSQKSELARDEQDWSTLSGKSHESGTTRAAAKMASVADLSVRQSLDVHSFKPYSLDVCATPGCHQTIPTLKQFDHLNLCDEHQSKLDTLLKQYRKSYDIVLPSNMSDDDVHIMVYYNLLPSIDHLRQQLSSSINKHHKYIAQVLMALKACIYLYRMHLNAMPDFIQTIIGLFLKALGQCETTMKQLVSDLLKLLSVPFAICGIFIIWVADLLLSDDEYLSIALMAAGGGLVYWGLITFGIAATVVAGPIGAIAAGAALFGIGLSMFIKRLYRQAPHEYVVRAHINLNNVDDYLRQWIRNAF